MSCIWKFLHLVWIPQMLSWEGCSAVFKRMFSSRDFGRTSDHSKIFSFGCSCLADSSTARRAHPSRHTIRSNGPSLWSSKVYGQENGRSKCCPTIWIWWWNLHGQAHGGALGFETNRYLLRRFISKWCFLCCSFFEGNGMEWNWAICLLFLKPLRWHFLSSQCLTRILRQIDRVMSSAGVTTSASRSILRKDLSRPILKIVKQNQWLKLRRTWTV